jgi:hypothetical protein
MEALVMKVCVCPGHEALGKSQGVVRACLDMRDDLVLAIGCRSRNVRHALPQETSRSHSVNFCSLADIISTLDADVPLVNASFDTVVALDVLEHVDNAHSA